jgi:hypothetical protein
MRATKTIKVYRNINIKNVLSVMAIQLIDNNAALVGYILFKIR